MGWKRPYILHGNPKGCKVLFSSPGHALISLSLKTSLSHTSPSALLHFGEKKHALIPWHSRGCLSQKCLTRKFFHSCNMIRTHTCSTHRHVEYQANFHFLASKVCFLSVNHMGFFFQYFILSDIFWGGSEMYKSKDIYYLYKYFMLTAHKEQFKMTNHYSINQI